MRANNAAIELYTFENVTPRPADDDEAGWNQWAATHTRLHREWWEACKSEATSTGMSHSEVADSSWTWAVRFAPRVVSELARCVVSTVPLTPREAVRLINEAGLDAQEIAILSHGTEL